MVSLSPSTLANTPRNMGKISEGIRYDDLLQQSANKELFEMILQAQFSVSTSSQSCAATSSQSLELRSDELNALRYACGYVPYALLKRYEKRSSIKYEEFIECLGEMALRSEVGSEDFLSYTREWLEKVNRGGLFPLNDETFVFVCHWRKRFGSSFLHTWSNKQTHKKSLKNLSLNIYLKMKRFSGGGY